MPPSSKVAARHDNLRRNIASLAARLMAEDGIDDYGLAKRKAARQLGAADSESLPNNAEIEVELRTYQALYQGEEQRLRIRELRQTALKAMDILADFAPCLTGPVLEGTAGRYAGVDLEIFTDDAKGVEIFLLNQGMDYTHEEIRRPSQDTPQAVLRFELEDTFINVAIFDPVAERTRRRSRSGQIEERARAAALTTLIEKDNTP